MNEYCKKPENTSRILDSSPKASRQSSMDIILQGYKENIRQYTLEKDKLIQGKLKTIQQHETNDKKILERKFELTPFSGQKSLKQTEKSNDSGWSDKLKISYKNDVDHNNSLRVCQLMSVAVEEAGGGVHYKGSKYSIERYKKIGWMLSQAIQEEGITDFMKFKQTWMANKESYSERIRQLVDSLKGYSLGMCNSFEDLERVGPYQKVDYTPDEKKYYVGAQSYKTQILNKIGKNIHDKIQQDGKSCGPHVAISYIGKILFVAINTPNTSQINKLISLSDLLHYTKQIIEGLSEPDDRTLGGNYVRQIKESLSKEQIYVISTPEIPKSRKEHLGTVHAEMLISEHLKSSLAPEQTEMSTTAYDFLGRNDVLAPIKFEEMLKRRTLKKIDNGKRVIRLGGTLKDCKLCHAKLHGMGALRDGRLKSARGSILHEHGKIASEIASEASYDFSFGKYGFITLSSEDSGNWHPGWRIGTYSMESRKGAMLVEDKDTQRKKKTQELLQEEIVQLIIKYNEGTKVNFEILTRIIGLICSSGFYETPECGIELIKHALDESFKKLDEEKNIHLICVLVDASYYNILRTKFPSTAKIIKESIEKVLKNPTSCHILYLIHHLISSPDFLESDLFDTVAKSLTETIKGILDKDDLHAALALIDRLVSLPHFLKLKSILPSVGLLITGSIKSILDKGDLDAALFLVDSLVSSPHFLVMEEFLDGVPKFITDSIERLLSKDDLETILALIDSLVSLPHFLKLKSILPSVGLLITGSIKSILDKDDLDAALVLIDSLVSSPHFLVIEEFLENVPKFITGSIKSILDKGDLDAALFLVDSLISSPHFLVMEEFLDGVPKFITDSIERLLSKDDLETILALIDRLVSLPHFLKLKSILPSVGLLITGSIKSILDKDDLDAALVLVDSLISSPHLLVMEEFLDGVPKFITDSIKRLFSKGDLETIEVLIDSLKSSSHFLLLKTLIPEKYVKSIDQNDLEIMS